MVLAGLTNALEVVGKSLSKVRIAMVGAGAANVANYELLCRAGVNAEVLVVCDTRGIIHDQRPDLGAQSLEKQRIARQTNREGRRGGIAEALVGADVCLAFSTPGPEVIRPEWLREMANDAILFACSNPVPEIWPWDAAQAGVRVVATGRSDFANQVNNSLAFPGIFRGVLDVRASRISDEMAIAAARAIAEYARKRGLRHDAILPRLDDWEMVPEVAVATALQADAQGLARIRLGRDEIASRARASIERARAECSALAKAR